MTNDTTDPYVHRHDGTAIVPREFVTQPLFTATKQTAPRTLDFDGVKWTIAANRKDGKPSPTLDMRHGRICFALMAFRDRVSHDGNLRFSINELAHAVANSNGGRYARDLLESLFDLRETWVRIEYPADHERSKNHEREAMRDGFIEHAAIIERIVINEQPARRRDAKKALDKQQELWMDHVTLNAEFFGLLREYQELAQFDLAAMVGMTSETAQAIYAFLPSRAFHHGEADPFKIKLARLMEQIGLTVPAEKKLRKQRFTQRKPSILDQLDGAPTPNGPLRVKLAESADGSDWMLLAWLDRPDASAPKKLASGTAGPDDPPETLKLWLAAGRGEAAYRDRMKQGEPLNGYHEDLLTNARCDLKRNRRFYEVLCRLLPRGRFEQIAGELKADVRESNGGIRNPSRVLTSRLMRCYRREVLGLDA